MSDTSISDSSVQVEALKPCPHCGTEPWGIFGPNDDGRWWVECHGNDDSFSCGHWHHQPEDSNVALRLDGKPYANGPRIDDPAVAVYFSYRDRPMAFACDRWNKVEDNVQAIRKTIEALRGIARWGTGDMLQAAFTGFAALPPPIVAGMKRPWRDVMGFGPDALVDESMVTARYRMLASEFHPDRQGGDSAKMAELNQARDEALKEV